MATAVVMPRQGNTVESCIIVAWKKRAGDPVAAGDVLCEIETDKATMEVESPAAGTLLALFFAEGDDVPVLTNIAAIGAPGEDVAHLRPDGARPVQAPAAAAERSAEPQAAMAAQATAPLPAPGERPGISPRARHLAERKGVDVADVSGTGPGGRVIERDVQAALAAQPRLSPVAQAMVTSGGYAAPAQGSGPRGRVMARDLATAAQTMSAQTTSASAPAQPAPAPVPVAAPEDEVEVIAVRGVRKIIAERMLASLQSTAQLTMNASADARALLAYRQRLKASDQALGLQQITLNDLILFVAARTLPRHPALNALFLGEVVEQHRAVHLGFAVDTPRGLIVPVIRHAHLLSLKQLAAESGRLAAACLDGTVKPDDLTGGTFTVTNLGSLGVESFTPILNPPQVGILGVGGLQLKPVEVDGEVKFVQHIGLSLTINHQVVDGAPGARFLRALVQGIGDVDLWLAT